MAKSFKELNVWQTSMELALRIYELTSAFPIHECYGLSAQMRRAAVSISSNIAEGAGRETRKSFRHFVLIARGSNFELQTQLMLVARLNYVAPAQLQHAESLAADVGKMLNGLLRHLKAKPAPPSTNNKQLTTSN